MITRNCTIKDVDRIRKFVNECKPLELHTPFTYWTLFNYFSNLCFLIEEDEKTIGFISGIKSSIDKDVVYLWQIGVSEHHRGKNYASLLIDYFVESVALLNCSKIHVSISPKNMSSYNAFFKYAKGKSYSFTEIGEVKYHDQVSNKDEYEILYQIRL
ncbi:MAG: GNAT family N-acetyltransferase [Candidatus Methanofastidiosa archaeon]|nr:GNAT family N-acetyltransferase [Candidatus Methanofastidiosa archaeon]HOM95848.1 GNAT family N-acetyltransferase [Methanofastidiosum sp.]HPC80962.1 GNAT family N-acetyltransferase [Methanofastidiosum sp.]HRS25515.1 GNAT family N-acetyltransferase [Methanofastidiosum sp.]